MRKVLLALAPWMVALAAAQAEGPFPAEVVYAQSGRSAMPAWQIGNECYVPVDLLGEWGWTAKVEKTTVTINAEGKSFSVPYRTQSEKKVIALGKAVGKIGATGTWKLGTRTFEVWGSVRSVTFQNDELAIETSLSAKPQITYLSDPDRMVLDYGGMRISESTLAMLPEGVRGSQYQPNVVRLVVETQSRLSLAANQIPLSRRFSANLKAAAVNPGGQEVIGTTLPKPPVVDPKTEPVGAQGSGTTPVQTNSTAEPVSKLPFIKTGPPILLSETEPRTTIQFQVTAPLMSSPQIKKTAIDELELTLPGALYEGDMEPHIDSAAIQKVTVTQGPASTIVLVKLSRPLGAEVTLSGSNVLLTLIKPRVGDGKLSSKVIVVDAGHGGHDSGAKAPDGGTLEKTLTLAISKRVADSLTAEGATVIMTRKTDVFIELKERPAIANRTNADFFISVHINSNRAANTSSGTITFFHQKDMVSQLLAESIQNEIGKVSGLKSIGTWSDGRIYDTGFAVLRYAQMPAVLVEVGFINHKVDREKMRTEEFQIKVADAIVKGIKVYLGDGKEEK